MKQKKTQRKKEGKQALSKAILLQQRHNLCRCQRQGKIQ
jgi:hypothetical protein